MESEGVTYRYELKYVCSDLQLIEIEKRLGAVMEKDPHVNEKGHYTIRSLYFDDYYDSCFLDKENGTDERKKYRLRYYDEQTSHMNLEIKYKVRDKTRKEKNSVTLKQYEQLILPAPGSIMPEKGKNIVNQLLLEKALRLMEPVIIVEYDRVPYIAEEGNVRVTLDKQIRSSAETEDFLKADIPMRSVMPMGQQLLEVKFDEFLPDYLFRALNLESMQKTSFSKYYLCRNYH